jgi:hypothetical protein
MSILSRIIAGALLAAALTLGMQGPTAPRARAEHPEFTPICGPLVSPLGGSIEWDPPTLQKLQEELLIESARYDPEARRFRWVMRTKRAFPGGLAEAEEELGKVLKAAYKDKLFCAYFYDAEGRKVGIGQVFFLFGERRPDNTFSVFADLNLSNADLVASRAIITLCDRPPPFKAEEPGKEPGKNGKP